MTDYLVGPQLDDALAAEQDIIVSWPFAEGQITDFMQAEALWYVCPLPIPSRAAPLAHAFVLPTSLLSLL